MTETRSPHLLDTIDVGNTLGEGVLWRSRDSSVWWTDIQAKKVYWMRWPSKEITSWPTPERLGSFAFPDRDSDRMVAAFESGFAMFEPSTSETRWLDRPAELGGRIRLNDGRTDPAGRFWAGSMNEDNPGEEATGVLYCLDANSKARAIVHDIGISNGLCWSPDGDRMYFADSSKGIVYRAEYKLDTGSPGPLQPWLEISHGVPDGAVTDARGNLWIAIWGGSRVDCYSPAGEKLTSIALPVPQPTCPAFGGADGKLMFITSARDGLSGEMLERHPQSGALFVYTVPG